MGCGGGAGAESEVESELVLAAAEELVGGLLMACFCLVDNEDVLDEGGSFAEKNAKRLAEPCEFDNAVLCFLPTM